MRPALPQWLIYLVLEGHSQTSHQKDSLSYSTSERLWKRQRRTRRRSDVSKKKCVNVRENVAAQSAWVCATPLQRSALLRDAEPDRAPPAAAPTGAEAPEAALRGQDDGGSVEQPGGGATITGIPHEAGRMRPTVQYSTCCGACAVAWCESWRVLALFLPRHPPR